MSKELRPTPTNREELITELMNCVDNDYGVGRISKMLVSDIVYYMNTMGALKEEFQ